MMFFFFKQKTAYEMRISDWSSDVCSSDLPVALRFFHRGQRSDYNAFVGEQNLLQNLWYLLGTTGVVVEAVFLEAMPAQACEQMGRSQVAARAQHVIRQAVDGKAD